VPRRSSTSKPRGERLKALPWAALLRAAVVVGKRWRGLSEKERSRLTELLRESGGRVGRLSDKERKELRKLAGKLDLKGMGRELLPLARGRRARRKSRRSA
jgi:hypothetical protein